MSESEWQPRNRLERRWAARQAPTGRSQARAQVRGEVVVPEPVRLRCRDEHAAGELARRVIAECKMAARAQGEHVLLDGRTPTFLTFVARWAADRGYCTPKAATVAIQACQEKIAAKAAEGISIQPVQPDYPSRSA